jgi:tRNA(Ile)-lysidine synthase
MLEPQALQQFDAALQRHWQRLAGRRARVLLAVSGGVDSMVLLEASARLSGRLGLVLEVATIDHQLRETSASEALAVAARCAQLALPCQVRAVRLEGRGGLEAEARSLRYAALEAVRAERGLTFIATAHTASDQAETVLMRLGRGASLDGAAGIAAHRGDGVLRPLLFATRAEVLAWAHAHDVRFVDDPMNGDARFLRTRVRERVLPALTAAAGPHVVQALARFAEQASDDAHYLKEQAAIAWARVSFADGSLDAVAVEALPRAIARRVLALLFERSAVPVDAHALDDALAAVADRRTATLEAERLLTCRNGRLLVEPAPARKIH